MNHTAPLSHAPHHPDHPDHSRDTGALAGVAALTLLITIFIVLVLSRTVTSSAIVYLTDFWPAAFILAPLVVASLTTTFAWLAIRFIRIVSYARALRTYVTRELARSGLTRGHGRVSLVPLRSSGTNNEASGSAARRLEELPRGLLLGDEGAGKSVTLMSMALRRCATFNSVRATLGLAPLPALLWLPGLANTLASGLEADAYLAAWFTRCGARGLGARAPRLLRRGALILLCDDYDMLDADGRERVSGALHAWRSAAADRLRIIVACDRQTFERDLDGLDALAEFPIERLEPLKPESVARGFIEPSTAKRLTLKPAMYVSAALERPVGVSLTSPAVARALAETCAAGRPPAWGLSELLRQQLLLRRERGMANLESDGQAHLDVALVWGALASSLIAARSDYLPLDVSLLMGECAAAWLTDHAPFTSVSFALQQEISFDAPALERALRAGIEAGVLRRQVDGLGLTFIHPLMRKVAAAYWLDAMDNGLGRLNSELLTSEWTVPTVFWAGARNDAADIAQRIYRLTQSPESVARRTGFMRSSDVAPIALALALAVALDGTAPWLLAQADGVTRDNRRWFATQQELRDLLDAAAIMAANDAQRPALMSALRQVGTQIGPTLEASVHALITHEALDRLTRAQLILLLGLMATPGALQRLLAITGQPDITLRQAARQALIYAGVDAIPTLQTLAGQQTASDLRERANEALRLVMANTPGAPEIAGAAAISGLSSADPRQRRAAVTTLSAIRASDALDALIARLDDTSLDVRVAATRAIAQLGAADGLAALRKHAHAEQPAFRRAIAEALGAAADAQSLATLLNLLRDRDSTVRGAAATALGAQGDSRAIGPLREAASDSDPWVSQAAQAAIRRLTGG